MSKKKLSAFAAALLREAGKPRKDQRPECPACEGTGVNDDDDRDCKTCGGEGKVDAEAQLN